VDRKHALKWLFPQEKATFRGSQKVYMYSENALNPLLTARRFASLAVRMDSTLALMRPVGPVPFERRRLPEATLRMK
jgi:hypothetical protein